MKKIYFSTPMAFSTPDFTKQMEELKKILARDYEVLGPTDKELKTPQEIYAHCMESVRECDLFLVECSLPATGSGFEIATAIHHNKPILAVARPRATVSNLIQGITDHRFSLVRYAEFSEVADAVDKKLQGII